MILMHVSGVSQQFEQSFVELFVIKLVDKRGICLAERIIDDAFTICQFVNRNERRTNSERCSSLSFLGL